VMMARDSITRTGARAPGVERLGPLARRCHTRASSLTQSREYTVKAVGTKDEGKPGFGKALSDIPALKPYRGKLAVRNFKGRRWKRRHHSKPGPRHCLTRQPA